MGFFNEVNCVTCRSSSIVMEPPVWKKGGIPGFPDSEECVSTGQDRSTRQLTIFLQDQRLELRLALLSRFLRSDRIRSRAIPRACDGRVQI